MIIFFFSFINSPVDCDSKNKTHISRIIVKPIYF